MRHLLTTLISLAASAVVFAIGVVVCKLILIPGVNPLYSPELPSTIQSPWTYVIVAVGLALALVVAHLWHLALKYLRKTY